MILRPPRSTRTYTLSLHDALPISGGSFVIGRQIAAGEQRSAGDQGDERLGHFEDPCSVVPSSVVWPLSPDEVSSCGVARSSCPCLNRRQTTTKNIGTKKITKTVAESMPPTTARPMAFCPPAPAPFDTASGSTPNTKASRSEEHTSELQSLM